MESRVHATNVCTEYGVPYHQYVLGGRTAEYGKQDLVSPQFLIKLNIDVGPALGTPTDEFKSGPVDDKPSHRPVGGGSDTYRTNGSGIKLARDIASKKVGNERRIACSKILDVANIIDIGIGRI